MSLQELVIQSQLYPPRTRKSILPRPRIEEQLQTVLDYPLTIVQAGTGYGKSTSLASLATAGPQLFWYTITEPDRDPLLFLVHLLSTFGEYGKTALNLLETSGGRVVAAALNPLLNALTKDAKEEAILVLDDFHLVAEVGEIIELIKKLVDYCPPHLHIVLSARHMPGLPDLNRWRVKGQVFFMGVNELAFTAEEIETLFLEKFHYPITTAQAQELALETEGWAIALQMIWQGIQTGIVPNLETAVQTLPAALDRLFDYLSLEVLARQPAYLQRFLLTTSVLRALNATACDTLLASHDSQSILHHLHEINFFVDLVGSETYRYQHLFHDFLLNQLNKQPEEKLSLHRRAAVYFEQAGHPEEALHHLLEAHQYSQAAEQIEKIGPRLLESGRLDSLGDWLSRLPADFQVGRPQLQMLNGDVCRLRAVFDEALLHYGKAGKIFQQDQDLLGQSRALRGQAQVFLDTVRPLQAAALLSDALDLLDPDIYRQETADLLEQLAENKLNSGFPDQARELLHESLNLRGQAKATDIYLNARILLRTGKLTEARRLLESYNLDEPMPGKVRPQHFHREKQLLLSLLSVLQGDQGNADLYARQGIAIGQNMQSEYVETVANMRLGHALQLDSYSPWGGPRHAAAVRCYLDVIEKVRPFKVPRVSLEPLWGLCRAYGYAGDVEAAQTYAQSALEISRTAGDEWFGHYVRITMGAVLSMDGRYNAAQRWLKDAAEGCNRVQDQFGWCAAQLWLALNAWWQDEVEIALRHLSALLPVVSENGYDTIIIQRTHLGLKDDQAAMPLLLEAYRQNIEREQVLNLLSKAGQRGVEYHPGYTLWVRCLGSFNAWRGDKPVQAREWQREKARQLFQLLITLRGQWLPREQIVDLLWPDQPADNAARDFKVALNALNRALEPKRSLNLAPYFIIRRGSTYGINPQGKLITDAEIFSRLAASSDAGDLKQALSLYEDDFLPDCIYADWCSTERHTYRQKYLMVTERLARLHLQAQRGEEALDVCQAAIRRDKCWEPAYALMMQAYVIQGNTTQALATYQRYETVLRDELGFEPSAEMQNLRRSISKTQ
jgi:LuxR family maltose regulon positive regulatory protein